MARFLTNNGTLPLDNVFPGVQVSDTDGAQGLLESLLNVFADLGMDKEIIQEVSSNHNRWGIRKHGK